MKKILVAYDGTLNAKTALRYGLLKAREQGGSVTVLSVFDPSRFVDYAHFTAVEVARKETARLLVDAREIITNEGAGIPVRVIEEEGNPEEEIAAYAKKFGMELILAPPAMRGLLRTSPCAVALVPGYIIFPVDDKDVPASTIEKAAKEAQASSSIILLLGIIPEHIYNKWEKNELEKIKRDTFTVLTKTKNMLTRQGAEVKEMMRSGYPDEEIMYAAQDFPVTMILITARRDEPSELNKAAAMIKDEPDKIKGPVELLPAN
jgi:nucleotide-binding universal stress UspA family protein